MTKWKREPWAVIDTETTGLDTNTARIWQIGVLERRAPECRWTYVNPGEPIPPEIIEICKVTPDMLLAIEQAPSFVRIVPSLVDLTIGRIIVGYNVIAYDWPLIGEELERAGCDPLPDGTPIIDVLLWVRHLRRTYRSRKLGDAAALSGLDCSGAHGVADDTRMTLQLLEYLAPEMPDDLDEVMSIQARLAKQAEQDYEQYSYWLGTDIGDGHLFLRCGKYCGARLDRMGRLDPGYLRFMLDAQRTWKDGPLPQAVDSAFRAAMVRP